MKTIRRKISVGFIATFLVLLCAIGINIFELNRLSSRADNILIDNARHTEYATQMLNALQKQNRAVLNMIILGDINYAEQLNIGALEFGAAIAKATEQSPSNQTLTKIVDAHEQYHTTVTMHATESTIEDNHMWFMNTYIERYYALDKAIKNYMVSPQKSSVAEHVSTLENSIYKTITPSVLTLLVAMIILLVFYYMIDTYYTKPVQTISRSLDNYAKNKVPYQVKIEEKSELSLLNTNISELINHNKKQ